jgi:hypothetical protein
MNQFLKLHRVVAGAAAVTLFSIACAFSVLAQRPGANAVSAKPALGVGAYDISRDQSLQGTVVSYTENSQTPPLGAHVLLQTAAGNVDVHLGDSRLLHLAKLNITPGMSIRFVGQMSTVGQNSVFLARLVQVGTQILAVRSAHGLPIAAAGARSNKALLATVQADQKRAAR